MSLSAPLERTWDGRRPPAFASTEMVSQNITTNIVSSWKVPVALSSNEPALECLCAKFTAVRPISGICSSHFVNLYPPKLRKVFPTYVVVDGAKDGLSAGISFHIDCRSTGSEPPSLHAISKEWERAVAGVTVIWGPCIGPDFFACGDIAVPLRGGMMLAQAGITGITGPFSHRIVKLGIPVTFVAPLWTESLLPSTVQTDPCFQEAANTENGYHGALGSSEGFKLLGL